MKHFRKILIALGILIVCFAIYLIAAYVNDRCTLEGHKTVICIPVYGQSLALGKKLIELQISTPSKSNMTEESSQNALLMDLDLLMIVLKNSV